jgi:excisionase family DNA binding protein
MRPGRQPKCGGVFRPFARDTPTDEPAADSKYRRGNARWGPVARTTRVDVANANDNVARDERAITVAAAAERLGCDQTTIRELLRKELLAGVRIGKSAKPHGVRVKLWSIEAWEDAHAIGGTKGLELAGQVVRRRRSRRNGADIEADARLKALGA